MLVHTAHLRVHQNVIETFRARLLRHASQTLAAEPGCSQFLVHQDVDDSALFLLVEHYADKAALDLHRVAPHYLAFREDVKAWIVERHWWFWHQLNTA